VISCISVGPEKSLNSVEMSSRVKLVYFSTRGAGELARLILAAGRISYENVRVNDMDKWNNEIKPSKYYVFLPQ
jgi:hypothetical protein